MDKEETNNVNLNVNGSNGWTAWSQHVLAEIKRFNDEINELEDQREECRACLNESFSNVKLEFERVRKEITVLENMVQLVNSRIFMVGFLGLCALIIFGLIGFTMWTKVISHVSVPTHIPILP